MLLLYAVVAGVLVGLLAGGRLSALAGARFRWWQLALAGLVFQLLLFSPPLAEIVGPAGPLLYVVSTAVVLLALLPNLGQPGFALIALGALLNFAAITANGGQMPAAPAAFAALTGMADVPVAYFSNSQLIGPNTLLPWLGDIFVLPRPFPLANVFSIGDVIIGFGGTIFIVATMRRSTPVDMSARGAAPATAGSAPPRPAAQHG